MLAALVAAGATVLTCTLPDPVPVMPITRPLRPRLPALNAALREAAARQGAVLVDFGVDRAASDPRLCSVDRLHANPAGHARIAARFGAALGLPAPDEPPPTAVVPAHRRRGHAVVAAELAWSGRYLAPWVVRRLRRRSSGDGRLPKRPGLLPVARASGPE